MLLFLVAWPSLATNDDYVALKALYEATFGSQWFDNKNWNMSNTDVCEWNDPSIPLQVTCSGGRVTSLCACAYA